MKKIIIIIPYFGAFPSYFHFWLTSAYNNPTVDFLIITDSNLESKDNVKVVHMTFNDLRKHIKSQFDFPVVIDKPYKLCDYKACYGYLFPQYIKDYDFWGFGDVDLVYGDLRNFFTDDILHRYSVISGWGHLTLYKNSEYCNTFFKIYVEGFQFYKEVLTRSKGVPYCEFNHKGLSDLWTFLHPDKIWDSRLFDDVRIPSLSFNFVSEFHPEYSRNLIFQYQAGKLFRIYINDLGKIICEETLYAHFQQRGFLGVETTNTEYYLIVPNKFIDVEDITVHKLRKWTKANHLKHKVWKIKRGLKKRWRNIFS